VVRPAGPKGGSAKIEITPAQAKPLGVRRLSPVAITIRGHRFRTSMTPTGDGGFYMVLNRSMRETTSVGHGDRILVMVELDTEPRAVDVPPELARALRRSRRAAREFERIAPSHRREYAAYVDEAKRPETRERRARRSIEMLEELAAKQSPSGRP